MERPATTKFCVGSWCVNPTSSEISREGETVRLEVRAMRLLVCLAEHPNEVVSIDDLLKHTWGEVIVTPDSVYQAVASLRRVLGDDPKQPTYIATVPRLGYRMVASVGPWLDPAAEAADASVASGQMPVAADPIAVPARPRVRTGIAWAAGAVLGLVLLVVLLNTRFVDSRSSSRGVPPPRKSVAVLPFVDLTEKMKEEEFADGMTEEVIDKLSKIPGFRIPAPTSTFYFKDKRRSVAEIASALDVAYVLDGSTRKSGGRLRVAARLVRADTGVVVWSESYDRPWGDMLAVQDDIAGEVAKTLRAYFESGSTK